MNEWVCSRMHWSLPVQFRLFLICCSEELSWGRTLCSLLPVVQNYPKVRDVWFEEVCGLGWLWKSTTVLFTFLTRNKIFGIPNYWFFKIGHVTLAYENLCLSCVSDGKIDTKLTKMFSTDPGCSHMPHIIRDCQYYRYMIILVRTNDHWLDKSTTGYHLAVESHECLSQTAGKCLL